MPLTKQPGNKSATGVATTLSCTWTCEHINGLISLSAVNVLHFQYSTGCVRGMSLNSLAFKRLFRRETDLGGNLLSTDHVISEMAPFRTLSWPSKCLFPHALCTCK